MAKSDDRKELDESVSRTLEESRALRKKIEDLLRELRRIRREHGSIAADDS